MDDGIVLIGVGLDTSKANKDLEKLKEKIAKAERSLNAQGETRNALEEKLNAATEAAEETKKKIEELNAYIDESEKAWRGEEGANEINGEAFFNLKETIEEAKGYLTEEESNLREQEKTVTRIKSEFEKVNKQYETGTKNLEDMKTQAGELEEAIEEADFGEDVEESTEEAGTSLTGFIKKALGITSAVVLFKELASAITDSFKEYTEYDENLQSSLSGIQATAKAIKVTIGSGVATAFSALTPIIQKITNWMLQAANAAARFIAIVSGQSSYKRAVVNTDEVAESLEDASNAASDVTDNVEEAKKSLLGFDELNRLDETSSNNDGGGSNGGNNNDGIDLIDEAIDIVDSSFLDKLALTIKDVLFDWSDLNPEQIAKKIIAGLGAVLGAALGITLGLGVGGVLTMTIAGLIFGLLIDTLIFDNDGKISKSEILSMIIIALGAIAGGIFGVVSGGGLKGALIGIWIGAALGLAVTQLLMNNDGKVSKTEALKLVTTALGGLLGGIAGLIIGAGPVGALIGFTIGTGIMLLFNSLESKFQGTGIGDFLEFIVGALAMYAGGLIGFSIGGIGGAAIGAIIGVGLTMLITKLKAEFAAADAASQAWHDSEFGQQVDAIKAEIEKTLETDADIRVHINSITGEVDEDTVADLAVAQELVNSIFTLDGKENLTTEEAELLRQQIESLNSLGLSGIQLAFDETTGHVQGTRQEIQGLLDDLLRQYQIEAMRDAYTESFKAQYESTENVRQATEDAKSSAEAYQTAQENLTVAQENYNAALADYKQYSDEIASAGSGAGVSQEAEAAATRLGEATKALQEAKEGVTATKETAEEAKTALETALDTADLAAEKVTNVGDALVGLVEQGSKSGVDMAEGFTDSVTENTPAAADSARTMGQEALDALATALDAHSPSKETEKYGKWAVEGFEEGIRQETPKVVTGIRNMLDLVYQEFNTNIERIKGLMDFTWSLPKPQIPRISWNFSTVHYGNGNSVSIPEFFVEWYAKGGIFDNPSLIGVGEDGKEAVVPLEKNTEWMQIVADGLMERLTQSRFANQIASAFADVPMPAMAGGSIAPPNALSGGAYGTGSLMEEIKALREVIAVLASQPIEVRSNLYMDKRKVGESVTEYQRNKSRAGGI